MLYAHCAHCVLLQWRSPLLLNLHGFLHCIHPVRPIPHHSTCSQLALAAQVYGPRGQSAIVATVCGSKRGSTSHSDIASSWIAPLLLAIHWNCSRGGTVPAMLLLAALVNGVHGRHVTASTITEMVYPWACAFLNVTVSNWRTQQHAAQSSDCETCALASAPLCYCRVGQQQRQRHMKYQLSSLNQLLHLLLQCMHLCL